jgi:MFS family permease
VAALERPRLLAGSNPALSEPALAPLQVGFGVQGPAVGIPRPAPELIERARRNPYVRLALNAPFSALWAGQVISLFGDRVHQVALAFLVYQATGSSIATAMVFLVATLPNLLFGPIAGTLVDRWDQKEVMVVSDLLRAACVLLVPVAAVVELWLVYPLVFLVTTISIFFRPARTAVLPRIVDQDDLLVANSATWIGETMADLIGYPLAAAFVALLGAAMPLAFWLDAATYVASAVLIGSVAVPPLVRTDAVGPGIRGVYADLRAGWEFLRRETVLLANTVQGVAGQFTLGILVAVTPLYCAEILTSDPDQAKIYYGLLETAIGVGNLLGGFLVGFVAAHLTKGRMVIVGYVLQGLTVAALAFVGEVATAMALLAGGGVANMLYVIASQTMFQERSPADMIGRVVGFRFALVFGSLTLAIGLAGIAVELVGIPPVLLVGGLLTAGAGVAGWFIPAVREA